MSSARNKRIPKYSDYVSYDELVSMFNTCVRIQHLNDYNVRLLLTSVHLVLEIALKKIAILYGLPVSVTSRNVGSLFVQLHEKDAFADDVFRTLVANGTFRLLQKFPYAKLRFDVDLSGEVVIDSNILISLTKDTLLRLNYLERASKI